MTNLSSKPFALVGIHVGGLDAKQLKAVMEKQTITWRSIADAGSAGAGPIATKWNLSATPTLYLIDHKGAICYRWAGGPPGEKVLDAALEKPLKAAEGSSHGSRRRPFLKRWDSPSSPVAASPVRPLLLSRPVGVVAAAKLLG